MIQFNAGTFTGDVILEKVSTYRDGGLSVQVKIVKTENSHPLLDNVNKICQVTFEVEGVSIKAQGELGKLFTYKNGGVGIDLVLPNEEPLGGKLLAQHKKSGTCTIEFSSMKGKTVSTGEPEVQPQLDGLSDEDGA